MFIVGCSMIIFLIPIKNTPHGAGYRICEKCGEKQTNWKVKK